VITGTLVNAVRGKPGAFVRAAQQLRQAGLDRARLDRYLGLLHELAVTDPGKVKAAAPLIARSLAIKIDERSTGFRPCRRRVSRKARMR
jgi:hypothetical protein